MEIGTSNRTILGWKRLTLGRTSAAITTSNRTILGWKQGTKGKPGTGKATHLIEPSWDGNRGERKGERFSHHHLIEPSWDGNQYVIASAQKQVLHLIEPSWDGNTFSGLFFSTCCLSSNRTILGWKLLFLQTGTDGT